jgi:hypothetical protein
MLYCRNLFGSKLPLNEFQRQDMLNNLMQELTMDELSAEVKQDLEETPQKKRKRGLNELSENPDRMC